MEALIQDSEFPYYRQLYEILRRDIIEGQRAPGELLPSESELIDRYEVSRITVRQAMDLLVQDGLVYRRRGRGTFVATPKIEQGLTQIISFSEDMRRRGFHAETAVLDSTLLKADKEIAEKLEVVVGEEIARLERLRLADAEPLSIEISHLVHRLCPGVLAGDYARSPLRELLERHYDLRLVRATQVIRAIGASDDVAHKLSIHPGAPLFYIERVSFSQYNRPVEFLELYHRGDRYALYNELRD
ncbi:MAG: GntR family transcriptional regulator [Candidatus Promineifilaceae bacterium]|nr:GntR family transcriptional regulator [Candidatus Promineifilaceae bacterium]